MRLSQESECKMTTKQKELVSRPHLFLDCDDVLADFTGHFRAMFSGADPHLVKLEHGKKVLYSMLKGEDDFYFKLPVLKEGRRLYEAVKHVEPTILTGHPSVVEPQWAIQQKLRWGALHFPGVPVVACPSRHKCRHMKAEGDVLVDDRLKYKAFWADAGGEFVLYRPDAVDEVLEELRKLVAI